MQSIQTTTILSFPGRAELTSGKHNSIFRLLPTRLHMDESSLYSDVIAAHRASITWYLNRRLTDSGQIQKEMQEERLRRQLERTRTLGSSATQDVLASSFKPTPIQPDSSRSWLEQTSSSLVNGTLGIASANESRSNVPAPSTPDNEYDAVELSEAQIQQFEKENADMLHSVQETLQSVQQAEAQLMSISSLQMELMTHLTRQTELTEQLYEDAIATTSMVDKGNTQLKEAKRRAKDSRIFILLFLVGASFSLLFLHYY
jgi:syntaxin 18